MQVLPGGLKLRSCPTLSDATVAVVVGLCVLVRLKMRLVL